MFDSWHIRRNLSCVSRFEPSRESRLEGIINSSSQAASHGFQELSRIIIYQLRINYFINYPMHSANLQSQSVFVVEDMRSAKGEETLEARSPVIINLEGAA
jgi:hypothetical protein